MNHKLNNIFKLLAVAGLMVAGLPARAQMSATPIAGSSVGLLGQNYYSVAVGYTHQVSAYPHDLNRYSFLANSAASPGVDIGLGFDWQTGSALGLNYRAQTVNIPFTWYKFTSWGRPFLQTDVGWRWQNVANVSSSGFRYLIGAGFEYQVTPEFVVTPSITYWSVPSLHIHDWDVGAQGAVRLNQDWSGILGVRMDEHDNVEFTIGANMHY